MLVDAARESSNPNLRTIIFRQHFTQMTDLVDKTHKLYKAMGATYVGPPSWTWTPISTATAGDLVLQGHPAILDTAEIYVGNGDGTFSVATSYTVGDSSQQNSFGIAIADFNGDGKPDIAVANTVLLGNGDGTFQGKLK